MTARDEKGRFVRAEKSPDSAAARADDAAHEPLHDHASEADACAGIKLFALAVALFIFALFAIGLSGGASAAIQ